MNIGIDLRLSLQPGDEARLQRLQQVFAAACNLVAPLAQQHRCWNRVTLHHLAYRSVRESFPDLGSQMACNAIYAVCRSCRLVYQGPGSPFNVRLRGAAPLPLLGFKPQAPVYFDRHTLSIKEQRASIFTLEGRMHCPVEITPPQLRHLASGRIQEIALFLREGHYVLDFKVETDALSLHAQNRQKMPAALPEHVLIQPDAPAPAPDAPAAAQPPAAR